MNGEFYKKAFWSLVTFMLGNVVAFFIFGLHTVSRADFDRATTATTQRLDKQDESIRALEKTNANLVGQLIAKSEISNPP